jgi:hypothetical protein
MAKTSDASPSRNYDRQIIGFSLSRDLAAEVKVEAARRKIRLKALFIEMWALYDLACEVRMEAAQRNISSKELLTESWTFYKNSGKKRA